MLLLSMGKRYNELICYYLNSVRYYTLRRNTFQTWPIVMLLLDINTSNLEAC
jgi:hypothetical protein